MKKSLFYIIAITVLIFAFYHIFFNNKENSNKEEEHNDHIEFSTEIGRISPPQTIPNFSFTDESGNKVNIHTFKGTPLIINFWATWCKPCIKELYQLSTLPNIFSDGKIKVITISVDSAKSSAEIKAFLKKHNAASLPAYTDKNLKAYEQAQIFGIPTSIIVDKNLQAHYKISGYLDWLDLETTNIILDPLLD